MTSYEIQAVKNHVDNIPGIAGMYLPVVLAWVELYKRKLDAVGEVLSENGCDCECDHDFESHDDDCERCLACRVQEALNVR